MKTVLITGANKGIGFEAALQLGQHGFQVILSARDEQRLKQATQQLANQNISVLPLQMDVSDRQSIQAAFESISKQVSKIDVLVNNAGILIDNNISFINIRPEDLVNTVNTNAFGAFFTVQTFLPLLNSGSRVINVSSGSGQICNQLSTYAPAYCLSKTTMNAITLQLATSLGPKNISVNAMCPSWVRTDMGGSAADRSVEKGAETIVWLAEEASVRLTGKFFRDKAEISW